MNLYISYVQYMLTLSRIFQNIASDGLAKAIMATTYLVVIREMNSSDWAEFSLQLVLATITYQIIFYAINQICIIQQRSFNIRMAATGISISILILITLQSILTKISFLALIYLVGLCIFDLVRTSLHKMLKFRTFSLVDLTRASLILLSTGILVVSDNLNYSHMLLALTIPPIIIFIVYYLKIRSQFDIKQALSSNKSALEMNSNAVLYFVYIFSISVLGQLELFFVKNYNNPEDISVLAAASRYYSIAMTIVGTLNTIYFGTIAKLNSNTEIRNFLKNHFKFITISIPFVLAAIYLAPFILNKLNNGKYPESYPLLSIYSIALIFAFLFSPYAIACLKMNLMKYVVSCSTICLGLNVFLNYMTIHLHNLKWTVSVNVFSVSLLNICFFVIYILKMNKDKNVIIEYSRS